MQHTTTHACVTCAYTVGDVVLVVGEAEGTDVFVVGEDVLTEGELVFVDGVIVFVDGVMVCIDAQLRVTPG